MWDKLILIFNSIIFFYISIIIFTMIFYFLLRISCFGISFTLSLNKLNLIKKSKRNIFYLRQAILSAIPFIFCNAALYLLIFKQFNLYYKIVIFFSIFYALYLSYSYVHTKEVFSEAVKDYFNFNKKYINNKKVVLEIKKVKLEEELMGYSGSPNKKLRDYLSSIK